MDTDTKAYKGKALVIDIDGTLSNIEHRRHYVMNKPTKWKGTKMWREFNSSMHLDTVNPWCLEIIERFKKDYSVILCTGRMTEFMKVTVKWLTDNQIHFTHLYMREDGDYRGDDIVKEEILKEKILPQYDILFTVDDRQRVVDMWRKNGLTCLQCDEGNF